MESVSGFSDELQPHRAGAGCEQGTFPQLARAPDQLGDLQPNFAEVFDPFQVIHGGPS
jgi:hypothetical protein